MILKDRRKYDNRKSRQIIKDNMTDLAPVANIFNANKPIISKFVFFLDSHPRIQANKSKQNNSIETAPFVICIGKMV